MIKFGRQYRLRVYTDDDEVIITNPITIKFTVNRHSSSTLNEFKADIYNLSENVRSFLFQERWTDRVKKVEFSGGYDTLSTLFIGEVFTGYSYRQGSDVLTTIECRSSAWDLDNTTIYETIPAGKTTRDILLTLLGRYGEKLPIGAIGDFPEVLLRPVVLNGNVWDLSKKYSDGSVFVDNGKVFALKRNESIDGELLLVDQSSGLLATPKRAEQHIQLQMLFEPRIVMKQKLEVSVKTQISSTMGRNFVENSGLGGEYNGIWAVHGIQHMGTISEAVGGDLRTTIDLFAGGTAFKTVSQVVQSE